ncbi:MAG: bifunctional UDP-N-acetylglucosamine diphosphorylase/glucosamine-1-phosphate N-acetyltransferase GlmU [Trueperaceae bacterium]
MLFSVVILAAGQGTRMKSKLPKVLHEAAGRPLVEHVVRAVAPLKPTRTVIVIGHAAEHVRGRMKQHPVEFALQEKQLGTGHALLQTEAALQALQGDVMVLNGDGPLLKTETLARLLETQQNQTGMSLITCNVSNPTGLGRIVRDDNGDIQNIIEEKDTTLEQKKITEINPGIYIFDKTVFEKVKTLGNNNKAGEYYITDLPGRYLAAGQGVRGVLVNDETEVLGVNDRKHLAQIEKILQDRIREKWLVAGVTMIAPETNFIEDTVELAPDVVLEPGVVLKGQTRVGEGAWVGAYSYLTNVTLAPQTHLPPHTVRHDD